MRRLHLELTMPHDWERIESIRRAVGFTVAGVFGDATIDCAVSMVSAELLENAVKYGKADAAVQLTVEEVEGAVTITVTNEVPDGSPHPTALVDRVAWLRSYADPADAYAAALARAYDESGDGGLGLVRIAHEGGCDLSFREADGKVAMTAVHRVSVDLRKAG